MLQLYTLAAVGVLCAVSATGVILSFRVQYKFTRYNRLIALSTVSVLRRINAGSFTRIMQPSAVTHDLCDLLVYLILYLVCNACGYISTVTRTKTAHTHTQDDVQEIVLCVVSEVSRQELGIFSRRFCGTFANDRL
jgi:hypothetical protein